MTAAVASGPKPRHLLLTAILVFAWCALWGSASVANLLSGVVVASALVIYGVRNRTGLDGVTSGRVRPVPLVRLIALIATDLVLSTWAVAQEVLTPGEGDEAIIGVKVPAAARHHYLLLVVGITVTPGTAVVDADFDNNLLYLHLLHRERREEVEQQVNRLAELACQAFPHDDSGSTEVVDDAAALDDTAGSAS
ncbi:MAG: Na+/H+ antiporter subunit E [Actinomycetota bacterium]